MKKKWTSLLALLLSIGVLTACGDGGQDGDGVSEDANNNTGRTGLILNEMQTDDYVTLGDYKNMTVSVQEVVVTDEEREELLLAVYRSYGSNVADRAVKDGDTVNIDYVGRKDGVAFEGGTDSDVDLGIGSGDFIDGFESGLVGVMPGTTVDLNLSFPENFRNAELAGQPVVFTVTVNYILPNFEDMKDSVVAAQELEEASSVEELRRYVGDYLAEERRVYSLQNAIMKQLTSESTVADLPEALLADYKQLYLTNLQQIAASLNITADIYTSYYYNGMGSEDVAALYGEVQARQEILLQAIANKEGLQISDEDMEPLLSEYAEEVGVSSVEELLLQIPREQLRNYFMSEKVMEYLMEITHVETVPAVAD